MDPKAYPISNVEKFEFPDLYEKTKVKTQDKLSYTFGVIVYNFEYTCDNFSVKDVSNQKI